MELKPLLQALLTHDHSVDPDLRNVVLDALKEESLIPMEVVDPYFDISYLSDGKWYLRVINGLDRYLIAHVEVKRYLRYEMLSSYSLHYSFETNKLYWGFGVINTTILNICR